MHVEVFTFVPRRCLLRDGSEVVIRLFHPREDLPKWCGMIRACSRDTLWRRFELRDHEAIVSVSYTHLTLPTKA